MTEEQNKTISKLKTYHIILLGCLLGSLLILNSNYINEHKATMKLNKEKTDLFNSIISKRKLQEDNLVIQEDDGEVIYLTTEVCSKSSDDLKEYYKTGVLEKIGLNRGPIKSDKNDYIQALLNLITGFIDDDKNSESDNQNGNNLNSDPDSQPNTDPDSNGGGEGTGGRRLIELGTNEKENIKKYSNRILPSVAFLAIGLLSIFGWIFCCFCTCCNCCCCCCCKKPGCRIPCFIFTYIFYAAVVAVCIYGFTQTNKIFTGIANTECSFLKFFDDILDGEEKETRPKWIGINGVSEMLNSIDETIQDMEESNLNTQLEYYMDEITVKRDEEFMPELKNVHKNFYGDNEETETVPKAEYCVDYTSDDHIRINYNGQTLPLEGKYVLDIVPLFGKYENDEFSGYISGWYMEINNIDEEASRSLGEAQSNFGQLLNENLETIKDGLKDGKKALEKLRKPFNNVYDTLSDAIYDSSLLIDDYGKLTVKIVFGVLGIMNIGLAIFVFLICMFSGQSCADCCCCRCICKCATHILWNVLALFMIIAFIIGSLLSLFGLIGADMVEVLSFVVSAENFAEGDNAILLDQLGEGRSILEECFTGTGDLSHAFNFDEVGSNFNVLRTKKAEIQEYIDTFNDLAMNYPAYNILYSILKNKTEFINDTFLMKVGEESGVSLSELIDSLNNEIGTSHEQWDKENGNVNYICDVEHTNEDVIPNNIKVHPWTCEPSYRKWVTETTSEPIKNNAKVITDIINLLKYANGTKGDNYQNYYVILNELKSKYQGYLNTYLNVLEFFSTVIGNLINAIEEAIGDDSNTNTFSFLNGSFIQIDLKILLKYLKESLGKDLYTVGLCLVIVGFSLILSISSTILLIIIINVVLDQNKKLVDQTALAPNFDPDNDGKTVRYANAVDQKPF